MRDKVFRESMVECAKNLLLVEGCQNIGHGLMIPIANLGREVKATLPNEIFDNALKVKPCLANTISSLRQAGLIG